MRLAKTLATAASLALLSAAPAIAGAWTLDKGHWQIFNATTISQASRSFGSDGRPSTPTRFSKMLVQNCLEYGLTDAVTLFATPAYVVASVLTAAAPVTHARNASLEAGARILLFGHIGEVAIQGSYKTAGAFDLSVSANHDAGRQIEFRLLYGTNFKLFGSDGFVDFQFAQRWIGHPRPNETPIDLTAGLWLTPRSLVMAQSFNIVSARDAIAPYASYRTHKIELSLVEKVSRHWSIQIGAFFSPAGQNALVERGISVALWTQD